MNQEIKRIIADYCKTKPIEKAWVFGSFSRGEERSDSDVDIMVRLVPGTKMGLAFCGMMCDLEDLLHRPVDMVREGCLLSFAAATADRDKVLVYERSSQG